MMVIAEGGALWSSRTMGALDPSADDLHAK